MEKILLVVNAHKPDAASINFACRIAARTGSKLTGLFIENLFLPDPVSIYPKYYFKSTPQEGGEAVIKMDTRQALEFFSENCRKHDIPFETYIDKTEPIQEVIYESRFSDLLIVDPKTSFYSDDEQPPTHFVQEILAHAECPVLLAPGQYAEPEEIVFCYDGSPSSTFAIKQFTHLLPQFKNKKATLLEVNKNGNEECSEDHRRFMAWLRTHYNTVQYKALTGTAKDGLFTYFFMKTAAFGVMGSYGRSKTSRFFKQSTADVLIRTVDLPLFITHNQ